MYPTKNRTKLVVWLVAALALIAVLSAVSLFVSVPASGGEPAEAATVTWGGGVSTSWTGSGTSGSPYLIQSGDDLKLLSNNVITGTNYSGVYFSQTVNINLSGISWTPIGTVVGTTDFSSSKKFAGIYNGNQKSINNLYISTSSNGQGLFACVSGQINNLMLLNGSITGNGYLYGAFAAVLEGSMTNCINYGVSLSLKGTGGGLVGLKDTGSTITNCVNAAQVYLSTKTNIVQLKGQSGADGIQIGGIAGLNNGLITKSANYGYITADAGIHCGGIAGWCLSAGTITNCYNIGDVNGSQDRGSSIACKNENTANPSVSYCYNTGSISSKNSPGQIGYPINFGNTGYYNNWFNAAQTSVPSGWSTSDWTVGAPANMGRIYIIGSPILWGAATLADQSVAALGWNGSNPGVMLGNGSTYPFVIYSGGDLASLGTLVRAGQTLLGYSVTVLFDINLNSQSYTPVGNLTYSGTTVGGTSFRGTFNGNNKTISGMSMTNTGLEGLGLIAWIGGDGSIKDLTLSGNVSSTSGGTVDFCGGFAGVCEGAITNCRNNMSITANTITGGIAGFLSSGGNISNCYNTGTVSFSGSEKDIQYPGQSTNADGAKIGGIVGVGSGIVSKCWNANTVSSSSSVHMGGIAGWLSFEGRIWDCYNAGTVSASDRGAGIAGCIDTKSGYTPTLTRCVNFVPVTSGADSATSGIVNFGATGIVTNCYAKSQIQSSGVTQIADGAAAWTDNSLAWTLNTVAGSGNSLTWTQGTSYPVIASGNATCKITNGGASHGTLSLQTYANAGATVTATLTPSTGYKFSKITVGSTDYAASSFTITGDVTVTATFIGITYTIRYNSNNAAATTSDIIATYDASYTYGAASTFTYSGYTMQSWNSATNGSGTSYTLGGAGANLSSSQGAVVNLYAVWSYNNPTISAATSYSKTFNTGSVIMTCSGAQGNAASVLTYKWQISSDGVSNFFDISDTNSTSYILTQVEAGTYYFRAAVKAVHNGNDSGFINSSTITVTINPKAVSSSDIALSGLAASYAYTGGNINPSFTLKDLGTTLTLNTDYTVTYTVGYNKNVSTGGRISVSGTGNYSGGVLLSYTITPIAYSITPSAFSKTYGESDPALTESFSTGYGTDTITVIYTRETGENGGTYDFLTVSHTVANPNYTLSFSGTSNLDKFTVLRYVVYVTPQSFSKTYGSADPALTQTVSGFGSETIVVVFTRATGQNAGFYHLLSIALQTPNPDYTVYIEGISGYHKFGINPYSLSVTPSAMSKTYGSADPALSESVTGVNSETLTVTYTREAGNTAGSYAYLTVATVNENYTVSLDPLATNKFSVNPYNVQITASVFGKTYGETDPALEETHLTGVNDQSVSVVYTRAAGTAAGSYNFITVALAVPDSNYTVSFASGGNTNKFVIGRLSVTLTADDIDKTYGDTLVLSYGYDITDGNLVGSDALTGAPACTTLVQAAGEYPITRGTLTNANNPNYDITFINGSYAISPYAVVITPPAATYYKYYADNDSVMNYTAAGVGSETFAATFAREAGDTAGTYDIVTVATANQNYTVSLAEGTGTDKFEIRKRPVSVFATATGHVYGGTDVSPLPYTTSNLPLGYALSGALTRAAGDHVSTYAISQGTLTNANNSNYVITFIGANYAISRRPITLRGVDVSRIYGQELISSYDYTISSGTLVGSDALTGTPACPTLAQAKGIYPITRGTLINENNPDYDVSYMPGEYEITVYVLQVTPDFFTKTYGETDPALTQIVDGIIPGEQVGVIFTRSSGNNTGTYNLVTVTSTDLNYGAAFVSGTGADKFSITRRDITVTATPTGHTFGNPSVSFIYTTQNMVSGDSLSGSLNRETGTVYRETGYQIWQNTVTNANNANYNITYVGAVYMIYKRPVTVTAADIDQIFGNAEIALSISVANTVAGYPLSGNVSRESGTDAGEYDILPNTITPDANPNYEITYIGGTYTITKRPITIYADNKSSHYGDPELDLTFQVNNISSLSPLYGGLVRSEAEDIRVGTYAILAGTLNAANNPNYTITYLEGVYSITRRPVAITPSLFSKVYGDEDPALIETINGIETEPGVYETFTITYRRSMHTTHNAGSYDLEAITAVSNTNYIPAISGTDGIGKFVIQRYDITVFAIAATQTYGEAEQPLTFEPLTLPNAEVTLTGDLTRETGIHWRASGYAILQGTVNNTVNANYNITFVSAVYTINKRQIKLTADNISQVYGSAAITPTFTLTEGTIIDGDTFAGGLAREAGTTVRQGGYVISRGSLSNTDYEITFTNGTYTITRALLSVVAVAKSITYGEDDLPLTYLLLTPLFGSDILTGTLTRDSGTDANEEGYDILLGTLGNPNYLIDYVPAKYIIFKRHISITANYCSQPYGNPPVNMTYSVTEGSLARDGDLNGELTRTPGDNYLASGYKILQGTVNDETNPNYVITFFDSTYMIEKRQITVTATDLNQIYGNAPLSLEYGVTAGTLREGDTLTGTLVRELITDVGSTLITAGSLTNANNQNYNIQFINGNYNVLPRPITVTADNINVAYGQPEIPLTYTITEGSLVGSDALQYNPARLPGTVVGTYEIRIGSLYHSNYSITFIKGTYSIIRRELLVSIPDTTMVYDGTLNLTPTLTGLVGADALAGTARLDYDGALSVYPAGSYTILAGTITNANNPNYNIVFNGGVCVIVPRTIRIILRNQYVEFGSSGLPGQNAYDVYDADSGTRIANNKVSVSITRTPGNAVGSYPLMATCEDPNYAVSITFAFYRINKIATSITVGANSVEMAYSGIPYRIVANVSSTSALIYSVAGQGVANAFTEPGIHEVVITAQETDVYAAPTPVTVTIVIKSIVLTSSQGEITRKDGFSSGASLQFTEAESLVDTSAYLTRTETLAATYDISISGDNSGTTSTLRLKVPVALQSDATIKLLVTENGVTRVLRLSPSTDGYVSFDITGDATVSFVAPVKSTNILVIALVIIGLLLSLAFLFSIIKQAFFSKR